MDAAIELAQKAIAIDPSLASAYRLLGECHSWKRQYGQAIDDIETAIALDPNDAENYAQLSEALIWMGKPEEAITQMEKAMRLNPYYPTMYLFGLAMAQFLTQRHEEAIATLRKVLTRAPDLLWAHGLLAVILAGTDRIEEARAEISEAKRMDPDYSSRALREMIPFKDPTFSEKVAEALRKMGLKE